MDHSSRWIGRATLCGVLLMGCGGARTEPLAEVRWAETPPDSGRVVDGSVEITASGDGGTFPLTTIQEPAVGDQSYAIVGEVRYEGVAEPAYLEMWSVFPDGGRYFSRTLGTQGTMAAIAGDSDWRAFELPFFIEGATSTPSQLELNAVLPSSGRIWVGPLRLVGLPDTRSSGAWWSERTAGLVGGIGGVLIGILGALIGTFASRGKARRLVLGLMAGLVAFGAALLGVGAVALIASQPYAVTGSLLLGGVLLVVVVGSMIRPVKRSYAQVELRKMKALDAA
jgi:hypothetical protein